MVDKKGDGVLPHDDHKAAAFTAVNCVPHCLDHFVCLDGRRGSPHIHLSCLARPFPRLGYLPAPTDIQFFLEHHLFQPPEFRTGPAVAGGPMAADFMDDSSLSQN